MKIRFEIYGIVNLDNGKIYIGQTRQGYRKRFQQHKEPSDGSPLLNKAMRKHGADAFECELIDLAETQEEANEKEKLWIAALKTYKRENGYNLSMGGTIGQFNEETLRKMSEAHKGARNSFYGKTHTEEARAKMREAKAGKQRLREHPRAKAVQCIETGKTYLCVKEAQIETGINSRHIGQVANKQYGRRTAGGFHWEWTENK